MLYSKRRAKPPPRTFCGFLSFRLLLQAEAGDCARSSDRRSPLRAEGHALQPGCKTGNMDTQRPYRPLACVRVPFRSGPALAADAGRYAGSSASKAHTHQSQIEHLLITPTSAPHHTHPAPARRRERRARAPFPFLHGAIKQLGRGAACRGTYLHSTNNPPPPPGQPGLLSLQPRQRHGGWRRAALGGLFALHGRSGIGIGSIGIGTS
jgi:hypothetical protein